MEGSIRVLVVDDHLDFAHLVAEFLPGEDDRIDVETAPDGRAGLNRVTNGDIDCVVSDYDMPSMNGIEFLTAVRESYPDLPFILFTGKGSEAVAGEAISAGVTDYLQKQHGTEQYALLANRITNAVERARAETARDRHLAAIETATEGISILDEDGRFTYLNETYADLYGYDREELLGEHWELVSPDEEVATVRDHILPAVERAQYWHGETTGLRADGSTFVEDHTIASTDTGELISVVSDISDHKAQRDEIRRLRERFERFADVVPNGFFLVSPDYSETHFVNSGIADIYGISPTEAMADPETWLKHVHPDDRTALQRSLNRQRDGDSGWPVEQTFRIRHPERGLRWVLVRIHPVADQTGETVELAGVATDITEQKRQKEQLARTNTVLRTVFESLPMGVLVEDADRNVLVSNHVLDSVFGVPIDSDEVTGPTRTATELKELFAEPDVWAERVAERIEQRIPVQNEELHLADGRILERDYVPYHLPSGEANLWLYRDVTEERARAADLERRSAAIEATIDGVAILDADGEFISMNRAHAELFGYPSEELLGQGWQTLYETSEAARLEREMFPTLERTGEWRGETVGRTREGDVIHVEITVSLLADGTFICTNRDITERIHREAELEATRARYESLFENNPLAIWEEDFSETKAYLDELAAETESIEQHLLAHPDELQRVSATIDVLDVNQNAVEYYGADSKEHLLDNLDRVFTEAAYEVLAAEFAAIADGERRFRADTAYKSFDGERFDEMLDLYVPASAAQDYSHVFITGTDITERVTKERELRRERDRLDEFAGFVSHDLRGPLNVASGYLRIVRDEYESDALDAIERALYRMDQLITDLLTLAREGKAVGETSPVSLGPLVSHCWQHVETADARLAVETALTIHADRSRLTTLFENLVRNAVEHGGPAVTIRVGDLTDEHGFFIADDGPGIPPSEWDAVFESGYSADSDGTGLGLAIVGQVVQAHGWEISVTESAHGGARFEITGVDIVSAPTAREESHDRDGDADSD